MKINNPILPPFPILIQTKEDGIKMEQRLEKLGYTSLSTIRIGMLLPDSFPIKIKKLKSNQKIYRYGY